MLARVIRRRPDDGASAVEYGLLIAAIAAIIILLVFAIGKFARQSFQDTCDSFRAQADAPVNSQANCS